MSLLPQAHKVHFLVDLGVVIHTCIRIHIYGLEYRQLCCICCALFQEPWAELGQGASTCATCYRPQPVSKANTVLEHILPW